MVTWEELLARNLSSAAPPLEMARTPKIQRNYNKLRTKLSKTNVSLRESILAQYPQLLQAQQTSRPKSQRGSQSNTINQNKCNECSHNGVFVPNPFPYSVSDATIVHWVYWIPLYDRRDAKTIMRCDISRLLKCLDPMGISMLQMATRSRRRRTNICCNAVDIDMNIKIKNVVMFQNAPRARSIAGLRHIHVFARVF